MRYDIVIIGAGPAGLTAAIYARRAAKNVLVLEAMSYGGQMIYAADIENYPGAAHISGFDLASRMYEQAAELGAEFVFEKAVGIKDNGCFKTVLTKSAGYEAAAVIIATGSASRRLGLENEEELTGRGVSYCATCDGAFFKGKKVAVAGGGNTALEDALYLADIAESVTLIHRRDSFRGDESTVNALKEKKNVRFIMNGKVTKLIAEEKLKAIEITLNDGSSMIEEADGLFAAIGRVPENSGFASVIDLDKNGYAIAAEDCRTRTKGVFVAGDNRAKEVRQIVTAASDGAAAASEAVKYLNSI